MSFKLGLASVFFVLIFTIPAGMAIIIMLPIIIPVWAIVEMHCSEIKKPGNFYKR